MKKGWKKVKLGEIVNFISRGISPKYSNKGIIVLNQKCIRDFRINFKLSRITDPLKKKISDEKFIKQYDVLINSTGVGTLGRIAQVKSEIFKCTVDSHVTIVRPNKSRIDPLYFGYNMMYNQEFIKSLGEGATGQTELSRDIIKEKIIIVKHNNIVERKIATILSNYDDLIENNIKRIELLEKTAKLIYNEWFVKFKFPGHEKVKMVDSELGKIPEGWEVNSIMNCDLFEFISKNIKPFEGLKTYFATADIDKTYFVKSGIKYFYKNKPSRAQKEPHKYSVWFARMKDTFKVIGFTEINESVAKNSILSSGFAGFISNKNIFPFLYYTINSDFFHLEKNRFATGSTQVSLNNEGLSKILIIKPTRNIVQQFGLLITPLINYIFNLRLKNKTLSETRDLLLPKLINGVIDVSEFDIQVPEVEA